MNDQETLLRSLLRLRHLTQFPSFETQFRHAAEALAEREGEPRLRSLTVSERTWERWCSGTVTTMPRPDSCRVLESMFGHPVQDLMRPAAPAASEQQFGEPPIGGLPDDIGGTLMMATRRARQFSATADSTNVGPESLAQLREETMRIAAVYPYEPLAALLPDIVALQDDTLTLLEGRQPPEYTRDLYLMAGLASGMLAKASHDMRDSRTAMTHARLAWQCAANAEHNPLRAWVRGVESLIKYWAGQPGEALQYARAGLQIPIDGTTRVWLHALESRASAVLGDADGALSAIQCAADARERAVPDELDQIGGICGFPVERELYYAADAGAMVPAQYAGGPLGERAAGYAERAIAGYATTGQLSFGDQAGAHAALAIARIRAGEVDGAVDAMAPVLALPPAMRINGVVASAVAVHRELSAVGPSAVVADAQQAIEAFCHSPAALGQ